MPPKGTAKQLIARQRAKKQELLQQQVEDEEEMWDSQAEEVSEDEEEMESWDSLDEEEDELSEEEATEEKPPASSAPSLSRQPKPRPPTPPAGSLKASRRWDATESPAAAATAAGKAKRERRGYCSWRAHKSSIVNCLQHCGGNISFARRYLLFHHGVAFPRNVLYYYRHLYSPYETLGEKS
ncbi:22K [simian adenovirus 1]|uniref:22K n=1 Tax=simian adenovirus 1 TaxID=310540 RepID=Q5C8P4_9ADEN|nr:22K [Simian adenovirus 1]AAX19413.1 22K [Simian adenovirus 1]